MGIIDSDLLIGGEDSTEGQAPQISQEEARKAILEGFGAISGRAPAPPIKVQPTTGFKPLASDTSRSPGGDPEVYTQVSDVVNAAYELKVKELEEEIRSLEAKIPKTGRRKLLELEPFRFECTITNPEINDKSFWFSRMHLIYIMLDLFNTRSEENNHCCIDVYNIYNKWDEGIAHLSVDIYAETENLVGFLYAIDGMCSKHDHKYNHQYKGATYSTDEELNEFFDLISKV